MKIKICVGTSCHLMGASTLIDALAKIDNKVEKEIVVEYATCFSACQGNYASPVVKIDDEYYGNMTPESLKKTIKTLLEAGE